MSEAEWDTMMDSVFKRLVPKVLYFVGEHTSHLGEQTDSEATGSSVRRKKCQRCDQPATIHTTELVRGEWIGLDLCDRHAREHFSGDDAP